MTGFPASRAARTISLLQAGHLFDRHLDTQIAARHHDRVGQLDDAVEVLDRGRSFDLRHDRGPALHQLAGRGDILGALDERERHPLDPQLQAEAKVGAVLVGNRAKRQHGARQVHALACRQRAAGDDPALGVVAPDLLRPQAQAAVVEQDIGAGSERGEHLWVR